MHFRLIVLVLYSSKPQLRIMPIGYISIWFLLKSTRNLTHLRRFISGNTFILYKFCKLFMSGILNPRSCVKDVTRILLHLNSSFINHKWFLFVTLTIKRYLEVQKGSWQIFCIHFNLRDVEISRSRALKWDLQEIRNEIPRGSRSTITELELN